jgi:hypothetical protein
MNFGLLKLKIEITRPAKSSANKHGCTVIAILSVQPALLSSFFRYMTTLGADGLLAIGEGGRCASFVSWHEWKERFQETRR